MPILNRTVAIGLWFVTATGCSVSEDGYVYGQGGASGKGGEAPKSSGNGNGGQASGGRASAGAGNVAGSGGRAGGAGGSATGGVLETGGGGGAGAGTSGDGGSAQKPRGETCSNDDECESSFCRDGVCCDSQCDEACQACAETHTGAPDGTCADAMEGADPHADCDASDPETCGDDGTCDGEGACAKYGPDQVCAAALCSGLEFTPAGTCDGAGECATGDTIDCGEFPCSDEGCEMPCSDDEDCPTDSYCSDSVCRTCPTGQKVCDGACIAMGSCCGGCSGDRPVCENAVCVAREDGDRCTTDAECESDHCVDGYCCDSACTGQCQSCSTTPGTCEAVTTARTPCNGSGACAGRCNGTNGTSCVYPEEETTCATASCTAGMAAVAASCNGSGACSTVAPTVCAFGCQPGGTTCSQCRQKSSSNILLNPGFDGDAEDWTSVGGAAYQPATDAENCGASGSVLIETLSHEIKQCRPAVPDTFYSFGFRFRGTGPSDEPSSFCAMIFYKGSTCSTSSATSNIVLVTALGNLTGWVQGTGTAQSPPDAGSVLIDCAGQGGFGYYDQFFLSSTNATY